MVALMRMICEFQDQTRSKRADVEEMIGFEPDCRRYVRKVVVRERRM
jgi:hypothetical protein